MNWDNPVEVKAYYARWRAANRPKCAEYTRRYRAKHPEEYRHQTQRSHASRRASGKDKSAFKKWYAKNADRVRAKARIDTQERKYRKLGISLAVKEQMFAEQNGVCAICPSPISLTSSHLDHNHATMKVRALLCAHCNRMLGDAREDPRILSSAITYLLKYSPKEKAA